MRDAQLGPCWSWLLGTGISCSTFTLPRCDARRHCRSAPCEPLGEKGCSAAARGELLPICVYLRFLHPDSRRRAGGGDPWDARRTTVTVRPLPSPLICTSIPAPGSGRGQRVAHASAKIRHGRPRKMLVQRAMRLPRSCASLLIIARLMTSSRAWKGSNTRRSPSSDPEDLQKEASPKPGGKVYFPKVPSCGPNLSASPPYAYLCDYRVNMAQPAMPATIIDDRQSFRSQRRAHSGASLIFVQTCTVVATIISLTGPRQTYRLLKVCT